MQYQHLRITLLLFVWAITQLGAAPAGPTRPAVRGLDPVLLCQGQEVAGSEKLVVTYKGLTYQFANAETKAAFEAKPSEYAIQYDGHCALYPGMTGNADLFTVYDHHIYVGGNAEHLEIFKKSPAKYVQQAKARKKVAILIFPGVQIIDYTGPYEVFGQAGYDVFTVAETPDPITTNMGMTVTPKYTFSDCPKPDIIVAPGGNVPSSTDPSNPTVRWVRDRSKDSQYVMSVCNGAFWLANAGLLDGLSATTFFGMIEALKVAAPKTKVVFDQRFVDNGHIMTTAGLSSGIDGALHMIEKIDGFEKAYMVALGMEYNWQPNSGYARASFADRHLIKVLGRTGFTLPDGTDWKTLSQKGDATKWEKVWEVTKDTLTAQELIRIVDKKLSERWTKTDSRSGRAEKSTWKFTDEESTPWIAAAAVEPSGSQKGKYVLKIQINREVSPKSIKTDSNP